MVERRSGTLSWSVPVASIRWAGVDVHAAKQGRGGYRDVSGEGTEDPPHTPLLEKAWRKPLLQPLFLSPARPARVARFVVGWNVYMSLGCTSCQQCVSQSLFRQP